MMRIMFELKTEELGGKGCIMWSFIIYTACQVVGNQRTVTKWVKNVACMHMKVISNRLLVENGEERVNSEGLYEYRRIILKWILRNCIGMDFEYSCFGRALSDIIMNFVITCTFHKIVGNILIS
jgi:hypothetical protein